MLGASPAAFAQSFVLQSIAEQLSSWPELSELRMSATWIRHNGNKGLHFTITNVSPKSVEIDGATAPWNESTLIDYMVIDGKGRQLYPGSAPIVASQFIHQSYSLIILPGQSVEGNVEFGLGRAPDLYSALKGGNLLLMWAARVKHYGAGPGTRDSIIVSGATYVPKEAR
jgi:hypothetical protein